MASLNQVSEEIEVKVLINDGKNLRTMTFPRAINATEILDNDYVDDIVGRYAATTRLSSSEFKLALTALPTREGFTFTAHTEELPEIRVKRIEAVIKTNIAVGSYAMFDLGNKDIQFIRDYYKETEGL